MLDGTPNFRAVSGLPSACGRRLRPGLVFRSGELSALTRQDFDRIEALGIRLICDLRSASERRHFPTTWPDLAPARTITLPAETDRAAGMRGLLDRLAREPGPDGARRAMLDLYAALPALLAPVLQEAAEAAITGWGVPLLLHCHAGKDRTGVATALLLAALGIEREAIVADYLETAARLDEADIRERMGRTIARILGRTMDGATMRILSAADPLYIETAFAAVETGAGSLDAYFTGLGLTEDCRDRLRDRLLA